MAEACFLFSHFGIEESKIYYKKVEEYANKIFELESDSAYGHCYFGIAQSKKPAGMIDSVKHLKRAYDIDPNNPSTLMWLSLYASETGKPEIAKQCIKRILEIDPFSPNICVTSWAQLMTGEFDIALELASKNLNLFPNMDPFLFNYAHALSYNNQIEKAIEVYNKMIENSPEGLYSKIGALYIQAHKGEQVGTLERITQEVNDIAKWDESFSLMMAEIYALIFENDKAIDWLENTVNYGFINYPFLNQYDPFIENIRKEERFKILMEKVRHEWAILEV
jgi:tetratricopeptide (TPR) repeat protein